MISSNSRKILSLASSGLLVGATLVMGTAPANAAAGDVTIAPTTGTNYGVMNDDAFALTTSVNSFVVSSDSTLAYLISNPDQHGLLIDFVTVGGTADSATFTGISSTGATTTISNLGSATDLEADADEPTASVAARATGADKTGQVLVDFQDAGITTLIVSGMNFDTDLTPTFQVLNNDSDTTDDSGVLTVTQATDLLTAGTGHSGLEIMGLNDGNASISVQAWLDSNSDISDVDAAYASDVETISYYDPANISVISKLERLTATGRSFGADIEVSTATTSRQDFLMDDDGSTKANALVGSMKFNVSGINWTQIDLSDWTVSMTSTNATTTTMARSNINVISGAAALDSNGDLEQLTASNGKTADQNNEFLFRTFAGSAIFEPGDKYEVAFRHRDTDSIGGSTVNATEYSSPQFTIATQTVDAGADELSVTVAPTASSTASSGTVGLRPGVKAFTYTAQVLDGTVDVTEANIPVVARVEAGSFLPAGETLKVSGTTKVIDQSNEAVFVSGLTDADGHFSVTVTADVAAAKTTYNVQFYVVSGGDTGRLGQLRSATEQVATYNAAAASTFTASTSVLSATEATLSFSVADAFGEAVDTSATGKQYSVELKAPNTDDLELYAVVEDGVASFSFTNWLGAGESNVLTAKLYTGTSTSPAATDYVSGQTASVTLYAPTAASSVLFNLAEIAAVDVEYNDFITGKRVSTGPVSGTNGTTVAGSVVDANGAGIPGAPVTLTADGVQFLTGTTYSIDSVDLVTDASGAFTAEFWTHNKAGTGFTMTATSASLTDTVLIKTDLPSGADALKRQNLVFDVDMPSTVVVNTTYAVTASVKDVFGNPVDGATIKFDGFGSAQFNGVASVTKNTNRDGEAVVYLRSLKDIDGLSAVEISVTAVNHDGSSATASVDQPVTTDVATTSWDETAWSHLYETQVNFLASAAAAAAADAKVNAGSFKGYVAVYAKGYEGSRLSAKIGNDWVVVPALASNFERIVDFTGAGVDIAVRIYIDRVLMDTINLTTK